MTKHKHAEVIKAWADGATIQCKEARSKAPWEDCPAPWWSEEYDWRVKPSEPEKIYPKCHMPAGAISQYWVAAMMKAESEVDAIRMLIDQGIRCEVDAKMIVARADFDRLQEKLNLRTIELSIARSKIQTLEAFIKR